MITSENMEEKITDGGIRSGDILRNIHGSATHRSVVRYILTSYCRYGIFSTYNLYMTFGLLKLSIMSFY